MNWESFVATAKNGGAVMTQPEDQSESDGLKTFFRQFWSGRWDHGRTVIKTIRSQLRWAIQELRALKRKTPK